MGFRAIERVKGVHHTTVILWVKQTGQLLPDAYEPDVTPEVGELDELETFVGSKKTSVVKLAGGIELLVELNNGQDDDESDAAQSA